MVKRVLREYDLKLTNAEQNCSKFEYSANAHRRALQKAFEENVILEEKLIASEASLYETTKALDVANAKVEAFSKLQPSLNELPFGSIAPEESIS